MKNSIVKSILFTLSIMSSVTYATMNSEMRDEFIKFRMGGKSGQTVARRALQGEVEEIEEEVEEVPEEDKPVAEEEKLPHDEELKPVKPPKDRVKVEREPVSSEYFEFFKPIFEPTKYDKVKVEKEPVSSEYFEPGRTIFLDTTNVPNWANNGHHPYMYLFHNSNGSEKWIKMEKVEGNDNCFQGIIPDIGGGGRRI